MVCDHRSGPSGGVAGLTCADRGGASERSFREAMAHVCAPVSIVTATTGAEPYGTTVSAFSSLSLEPPMIAVSLSRGSMLLRQIDLSGRFGVNVLGAHQESLACRFAASSHDRFADVGWSMSDGVPRIEDANAWISCEAEGFLPGGDHVIVTGLVRRAEARDATPLTYYQRRYGTHVDLQHRGR